MVSEGKSANHGEPAKNGPGRRVAIGPDSTENYGARSLLSRDLSVDRTARFGPSLTQGAWFESVPLDRVSEDDNHMQLYPAIDISKGRCVRLFKGMLERETVYGPSPAEVASKWKSQGATFLHVVDLDGAFSGAGGNGPSVVALLERVDIPIQLGGGIRTHEAVENWLAMGVRRVILGTAAVENPEMVRRAVDRWGPERIVVGIDAKEGRVAVNGWTSGASCSSLELARAMKEAGICRIVYTDIDRDGTMNGLDSGATARLARESGLRVIASGGVAAMDDLERASVFVDDGLEGVVIGKSLYEGTIDLSEAVRRYQSDP